MPNMEFGYLENGNIMFSTENLQTVVNNGNYKDKIMVYDEYVYGKKGINGIYPIKTYTSKAKNTLELIR